MLKLTGKFFEAIGIWMILSVISTAVIATTDANDPLVNHTVTRTENAIFVADGINTAAEYTDVFHMTEALGSDFIEAKVYYKRFRDTLTGEEELRIYFSVHDITLNSGDRIDLHFDRLHNHGSFGDTEIDEDLRLRITRNACVSPNCSFSLSPRSGGTFGAGSALPINDAAILVDNVGEYAGAGVGFQAGWTGEFSLRPSDLGWSYFPQDLGHLVIARSEGQNAISNANPIPGSPASPLATYPLDSTIIVSANAPANWGNLKLRYPIDYAVIMDYSGSMLATDGGTESRWTQAKRAADLFVASLGLFKSDMLDDRISLSQYSWSCSDDSNSGNTTDSVPELAGKLALAEIPPPPSSGSYTADNATDPANNNCTPIKAGIEFALDTQLDIGSSSPDDKRDRIAILLSDGLHNKPSGDSPFDPDSAFSNNEKNFTQIRTVALGADGVADTALLAEISTAFNGGVAYANEARYNQTNSFSDLLEAYLETLQAPLTINQVPKVGSDYNPGAPDKLVFIGVWNTPENATDLTLTLNGIAVDPSDYDSFVNTDIGYSAIVLDDPAQDGAWQLASTGVIQDNEFVLADLRILSRFLIEQKLYAAGDPMLLQVSLHDNGKPILGVDVSVDAAIPGEGLGNYLSTVGDNCEPGEPTIPKIPQSDSGIKALVSNTNFFSNASAVGATANGDPKTGRYALSAYHFERCQKVGLDRGDLPGTKLLDDGTQGDLLADDGIYSLSFANTDLEGSYNFRFFALGATDDGVKFGRMRATSQYVGIEPDEVSTAIDVQAGPMIGEQASQLIFFLPRDAQGNYTGPGYNYKFKTSVSGGGLYGGIIDMQNGYYLQAVLYNPQGPDPVVTISTTDGGFETTVGEPATTDNSNWVIKYLWVIILLLLLFIIILIWLLLLCRKQKKH